MSGIMAAGVARDHIKALGENIDDLTFTFIAPLGTKDHGGRTLGFQH